MAPISFSDEQRLQLARRALHEQEPAEAISLLSKCSSSSERDGLLDDAHYQAGLLLCAWNRFDRAREHFAFCQSNSPNKGRRALSNERLKLIAKGGRASALENNPIRNCRDCGRNPSIKSCGHCLHLATPRFVTVDMLVPDIDQLYVAAAYRSGYDRDKGNPLSKAVRLAKSGEGRSFCAILGHILGDVIQGNMELRSKTDLIVPVPTSPGRYAMRGYSVPAELCQVISDRFCIPLMTRVLVLTRETEDTRYLSPAEKSIALEGAFSVERPDLIAGFNVLLVDDVLRDGTTKICAARELRKHGSNAVFAAAVASAESSFW